MEIVKATLLSEIQELQESLQIIARRVQQGDAVGSHTNVDSSKVNNLIGKYQLLMELRVSEAKEQS
jgi:predicted Abi (CAAX) family protease